MAQLDNSSAANLQLFESNAIEENGEKSLQLEKEEEVTSWDNLCTDKENNETGKEDKAMNFTKYKYPFENVAFKGGGVKGAAYAGAVQVTLVKVYQNSKLFVFLLVYM